MVMRTGRTLLSLLSVLLLFGAGAFWISHTSDAEFIAIPGAHINFNGSRSTESNHILGAHDDPARLYLAPKDISARLTVAAYNRPPRSRARTPLFIGFTANNAMLVQTVMSYLAVGWPAEDIIVVDNSGTMDANERGELKSSNSFFLDYSRLRSMGVAIVQTPTLLTFAQLQNFYLRTSIAHRWRTFFWGHMDVVVLGDEHDPLFKSFYLGVLRVLAAAERSDDWALKWFSYDALTLVNVDAWRKIGTWDPFIPYYEADCDAYSRMVLHGFPRAEADVKVGTIFDVAEALPNPERQLFPSSGEEGVNSPRYQRLRNTLEAMQTKKASDPHGRNTWQETSRGNAEELWSYNAKGFWYAWKQISEKGTDIYRSKWGSSECNLDQHGIQLQAMWSDIH